VDRNKTLAKVLRARDAEIVTRARGYRNGSDVLARRAKLAAAEHGDKSGHALCKGIGQSGDQ
jgi:hypothetical protein